MTSARGPGIGVGTAVGVEEALEADEGVRVAGVDVQLPMNKAIRVMVMRSDHSLFITPSSDKDVDQPPQFDTGLMLVKQAEIVKTGLSSLFAFP